MTKTWLIWVVGASGLLAACGGNGSGQGKADSAVLDGATGGDGAPGDDGATADSSFQDGGVLPPDDAAPLDDAMALLDGAPLDGAVLDGAVLDGSPVDASPLDATAFMDAAKPDATVFMDGGPASCVGAANGIVCPGSTDPNLAERCLNNLCVGTYVTPPPVGSDANPGTRQAPKATIGAAITTAQSLAAVAAVPKPVVVYVGTNAPAQTATFNENLTIPANVDLEGDYSRDPAASWTRAIGTNDTRIVASGHAGQVIGDPLSTRANTIVRGFSILGVDNGATSTGSSVGITVTNGASATLDQLNVSSGAAPMSFSAAVSVSLGSSTTAPSPLITGSTLTGGGAAGAAGATGTAQVSEGLAVARGIPEVRMSNLLGGSATVRSTGVACTTACGGTTGMILATDVIRGGNAPTAQGVTLTGDTSNVQITGSTITGGLVGNGVVAIGSTTRDGLDFNTCSGTAPLVSGNDIVGVVSGGVSLARGVHVAACSIQLTTSIRVVGVVPAGGPSFLPVDTARGVHCEGDGAVCTLTGNTLIAGARSSALNSVLVTTSAIGLVAQGRGTVARNQLIYSGDCVPRQNGVGIGARIAGTVRLENNVIVAGACDVTQGMEFTPTAPPAGGATGAEIVMNHIDGGGTPNSTGSTGVVIESRQGGSPTGVFLDNTILAGNGTTKTVVAELTGTADPEAFINNNLFGATVLYQDEASASVANNKTDTTMVNAMSNGPVARGNISADPLIVGGNPVDYHLQASSPNRMAGLASTASIGNGVPTVVAPQNDYDNMDRPQPANTAPDIGPDERQ